MDIGTRPPELSGCWKTWDEQDVDTNLRTEMDAGAVHTRRRFTGRSRLVKVTVTLPAALWDKFDTWYQVNQRQGSIPTYVMTPYGAEEIFQFVGPPAYSWPDGQ